LIFKGPVGKEIIEDIEKQAYISLLFFWGVPGMEQFCTHQITSRFRRFFLLTFKNYILGRNLIRKMEILMGEVII
jgi:hypothetical protein